MPASRLPAVHAFPVRQLPARLALPPPRRHRRRVLRVRPSGNRDGRDRLLPAALPCRVPRHALARQRLALHRICGPVRHRRACDLTRPPLAEHRDLWTDLTDYSHCQSLADTAREAGIEAIRYESVRDPRHRANIALLRCTAFARRAPVARQTWWLLVSEFGVRAVREQPRTAIAWEHTAFTADPRLADMRWSRPR